MIFEVFRSSYRGVGDHPPVEGAFKTQRVRVDRRTVSSPDQLRYEPERSTWYQVGTNHRVENGRIQRDMEMREVWAVDIPTLEALLTFIGTCGHEIVMTKDTIEIYDDYRE